MLLHELWLKARLPISWKRHLDLALGSFELLAAGAIASIAGAAFSPSMFGVAQMHFQFRLSTALNNGFG
jgi:hypothetical protein